MLCFVYTKHLLFYLSLKVLNLVAVVTLKSWRTLKELTKHYCTYVGICERNMEKTLYQLESIPLFCLWEWSNISPTHLVPFTSFTYPCPFCTLLPSIKTIQLLNNNPLIWGMHINVWCLIFTILLGIWEKMTFWRSRYRNKTKIITASTHFLLQNHMRIKTWLTSCGNQISVWYEQLVSIMLFQHIW